MAWYFLDQQNQNGPYEEQAFLGFVRNGTVREDTLVFGPGMADWQSLSQVRSAGLLTVPEPVGGLSLAPTSPQRSCPNCGARVDAASLIPLEGYQVCPNCRDVALQRIREGVGLTQVLPNQDYAGFWKRVAGSLIDGVVMQIYSAIIQFIFGMGMAVMPEEGALVMAGLMLVFAYAGPLFYTLYFMGHDKYRGTPGMMLLQIQIIRPDGSRVGRWRLFLRNMAATISALILGIGYLMVLWDPEKRTLHDMMTDTRVVNK